MKVKKLVIATLLGIGSMAANAVEFTLTDSATSTDLGNWKVSSKA